VRQGLRGAGALLLALAGLLLPASAGACGCGDLKGPVVARGTSPAGALWWVRAARPEPQYPHGRSVTFEFSYGLGDEPDGTGGFTGLPLALRGQPFVSAVRGGEVGPYAEYDVSGIVQGRTTQLVIRFSAGAPLTLEPQLPSLALRHRFPWLRGFRFFDAFYPDGLEPIRVEAFNRDGAFMTRESLG
jgi:hypothetical protein